MQPYNTTSSEDTPPNGDNPQQKLKHNNAAPNSNTSLQSSIPLKPASLPGLIMVNKLSAVISQQTSLLTNSGININMSLTQISDPKFCHIISQYIKLQVFCRCKFTTKSILEPTTKNQCHFVALCSSTVTLLLTKHAGGIAQER